MGAIRGKAHGSCHVKAKARESSGFEDWEDPANAEMPEAVDENLENLTAFDRVAREAGRIRKYQEEDYRRKKPIFMQAIGLNPDGTGGELLDEEEEIAEDPESVDLISRAAAIKRKEIREAAEASLSTSRKAVAAPREAEVLSDSDGTDEEEEEIVDVPFAGTPEVEDPKDEEIFEEDDFDLSFEGLDRPGDQDDMDAEPIYRMTLGELLEEAHIATIAVEGDLDVTVSGISHDSRDVSPGDVFVCCTGFKTDGHQYASQAVEKGAVVVVASKEVDLVDGVRAVVMVEDANKILSALAAGLYGHPSRRLAVVGITGTNGKTTTSYLLHGMYESMGMRTGLIGTIAYLAGGKKLDAPHTTPDAVALQKLFATMVNAGQEACVMEVSSHSLALDRVADVDVDIAVFTNLTRDHMDFHITEEAYREAKGLLFAKMVDPERHRKIVNIDDPNAQYFINQGNPEVPVVTYAMENPMADVYPLEVQLSLFETEMVIRTPQGNIEVSSGLLGRHNVYNVLAAVAVGLATEAPLEDIVRGVEEVDAIPGRCELIDEEQAFAVVVDYAHSPDALSRLLDSVRECGPQRIITVVGCGGDRDRGKRPIMAKIASEKSDITIITSDNPRTEEPLDIIDDMLAGVGWTMDDYLKWNEEDSIPALPNGHRVFVYDIRSIAVRAAVAMGEEGDAVVIAGKGHETYQIIGTEKEYFDDRHECREALHLVDQLHAAGIDTSEFPWRVPEF